MKPGEAQSAGVGDKSFNMGTICTNVSAGVLKGNTLVTITLTAFTSTNTVV